MAKSPEREIKLYNRRTKKYKTSQLVHRAYILCLREIEESLNVVIPEEILTTLRERMARNEFSNWDEQQFQNLFDRAGRQFKKSVREWEEKERNKYIAKNAKAKRTAELQRAAKQLRDYNKWLLDWSIFSPSYVRQ